MANIAVLDFEAQSASTSTGKIISVSGILLISISTSSVVQAFKTNIILTYNKLIFFTILIFSKTTLIL